VLCLIKVLITSYLTFASLSQEQAGVCGGVAKSRSAEAVVCRVAEYVAVVTGVGDGIRSDERCCSGGLVEK